MQDLWYELARTPLRRATLNGLYWLSLLLTYVGKDALRPNHSSSTYHFRLPSLILAQ